MVKKDRNWYEGHIKHFAIMNPYGLPAGDIDVKKMVNEFAEAGVDTVLWEVVDGFFNSKLVGKYPGLGSRDLIKELSDELHHQGMRFIASIISFSYLYSVDRDKIAAQHPDWLQENIQGNRIGARFCPNSPYVDEFLLPLIREIMSYKDVDGLWVDLARFVGMSGGIGGICFCRYCRSRYMKEFGVELPAKPDWKDPNWRRYWKWRDKIIQEWFKKCYEAVHKTKPEACVQQNYYPYMGGAAHDTEIISQFLDVLTIEAFYELGAIWKPGEKALLGRAISYEKKPLWIILHESTFWLRPFCAAVPKPETELKLIVADTIANGGIPQLWHHNFVVTRPHWSWGGLEVTKSVFDELDKARDFIVDVRSPKHAALLYSLQTREFYAMPKGGTYTSPDPETALFAGYGEKEWRSEFSPECVKYFGGYILGFYKATLENHVPLDYVVDHQLLEPEHLGMYKTLVLPNAVCLSDSQVDAVKTFVKEGGGLVATYRTSLADEEGVEREDFGLADVFHASFKGTTTREPEGKHQMWSFLRLVKKHPLLEGVNWEQMNPHKAEQLIVEPKSEAEVLAKIAYPIEKWWYRNLSVPAEPGPPTNHPALLVSRYGEGRVVYIPGQLDFLNMRWGYPGYGQILTNAINWTANTPPLIETNAPSTVEVKIMTQPAKKRLLIHLVNFTIPQYWTTTSSRVPTVNMIKEVIPVNNIQLKIKTPQNTTIKNIQTIYSNKNLPHTTKNGYTQLTLPKLNIHEIINITTN